ncbi:MAG: hypothetical protein AABW79_00235 [Nanoarchaeota archaeon]
MNNRGWLKIVEASISIIIVISALFLLYNNNNPAATTGVDLIARQILDEVARNESLRLEILTNTSNAQANLNSMIDNLIKSGEFSFEARICEIDDSCGKSAYFAGEVFAAERIIAATVIDSPTLVESKKIRLFMWRTNE